VTFSVTVPLTLTTTTSCIPLALFAVPIQTSACRRKREISLDYVPIIPKDTRVNLKLMNYSCMIEFWSFFNCLNFRITLPTAVIPLPGANRLNRQVSIDPSALSDQLLSPGDVIRGSLSPERHVMRGKRYFILSVTSTTVTTYSITSTAATKSVRLAGDMQVLCLPSGYIVCWTL
jgi:hypothetical protein